MVRLTRPQLEGTPDGLLLATALTVIIRLTLRGEPLRTRAVEPEFAAHSGKLRWIGRAPVNLAAGSA